MIIFILIPLAVISVASWHQTIMEALKKPDRGLISRWKVACGTIKACPVDTALLLIAIPLIAGVFWSIHSD
jgi:hypothetical protein